MAKFTGFLAGGDGHHFEIYDGKGEPLPAARVFNAYLGLADRGGRRLSIGMVGGEEGVPLQGVYGAASSHTDGGVTVVLNAAELPMRQRSVRVIVPWPSESKPRVQVGSQDGPSTTATDTNTDSGLCSGVIEIVSGQILVLELTP
ncbi:MAG: hypothetical protein AAF797_06410 [Planctomycetota bacterium]